MDMEEGTASSSYDPGITGVTPDNTAIASWDGQLVPEEPYNPERQDGWRQYDERVLDHLPSGIAWNIQGLHDGPPRMKLLAS